MTTASRPYVLLLEPILKPKVWGGRRLAAFGKRLPTDDGYGESWEVADLGSTSPTGGGGGAARSRIRNGAMAGRSLHDALDHWGAALVGAAWADRSEFPLLVKLLDAREHLSVQVHPTVAYAQTHSGTHPKSESWYVIDAAEGAHLFVGLRPGVHRADVVAAVDAGRTPDVLREVPAVVGECHHLPSGTIHALGAGVVVAEIQSPSDTTFRLYDWEAEYNRPPRQLHIDEAIESLLLDHPPPPTRLPQGAGMVDLATTGRYTLRGARGLRAVDLVPDRCAVVMCIEGAATVGYQDNPTDLGAGATAVIPASIASSVRLDSRAATVLIAELSG